MTDNPLERELRQASRELLLTGDYRRAEYLLWEVVRAQPHAPRAVYLLGLAILYQKRFREARRLIDRAYRLALWVDDRVVTPVPAEILSEVQGALPGWDWPRYQSARERWRAIGLSVVAAAQHRAAANPGRPLTFIQVGANDGRSGDPLRKLIKRGTIRGLMVEPQAEPFGRLVERYQGVAGLSFENVAIADRDAPIQMVTTTDRSTLGTLVPDRNILSRRKARTLSRITVAGLSFASLLAKHSIERFDLLQIDTEGYDYEVLKQVDLDAGGVGIVNLEYYCLPIAERLAVCAQLDAAGFAAFFGRMDLLAVRREEFEEPFCITDLAAV